MVLEISNKIVPGECIYDCNSYSVTYAGMPSKIALGLAVKIKRRNPIDYVLYFPSKNEGVIIPEIDTKFVLKGTNNSEIKLETIMHNAYHMELEKIIDHKPNEESYEITQGIYKMPSVLRSEGSIVARIGEPLVCNDGAMLMYAGTPSDESFSLVLRYLEEQSHDNGNDEHFFPPTAINLDILASTRIFKVNGFLNQFEIMLLNSNRISLREKVTQNELLTN